MYANSCAAAADCGPVPRLGNATGSASVTSYGSVARYDCLAGYFFSPATFSRQLTCASDGLWTPAVSTGCRCM